MKRKTYSGRAYDLLESEHIEEINSDVYHFVHKKSGAQILFISNDNPNKMFDISFLTSPSDDSGVAHILEHCILSGSRKYPVGSYENISRKLNFGYTNGSTSADHTDYYFVAKMDDEFRTCMDMYLDMVFHPLFPEDKNIFLREGHRLELYRNEDGSLSYCCTGVVLNEMKAKDDNYGQELRTCMAAELIPGTCCGYTSGGKSYAIPGCTYEDVKAFYQKFYSASNAHIFFYGDMDLNEMLIFLDESYLSKFTKEEGPRFPVVTNKKKTIFRKKYFPAVREERHCYEYAQLFDGKVRPEQALAFQIFEDEIEDVIADEMDNLGLGNRAGFSLVQTGPQDFLRVFLYSDAEDAGKDILEAVDHAFHNDFRRDEDYRASLSAKLNRYELRFWEDMYDDTRAARTVFDMISDYWLYDEKYVFDVLHVSDNLQYIRNRIWGKTYNTLVCDEIPQDGRRVVMECIPKATKKSYGKRLKKVIADKISALSDEEVEKLIAEREAFSGWEAEIEAQQEKFSEWKNTIGRIKEYEYSSEINYSKETIQGVKFYHIPLSQGKVVWLALNFNADKYKDHIEELRLLTDIFRDRGFGSFYGLSADEAKQLLTSYISPALVINRGYDLENNGCHVNVEFSMCVLRENIPDAIRILYRMLFDVFIAVPGYVRTLSGKIDKLKDSMKKDPNAFVSAAAGSPIDEKCWLTDRKQGAVYCGFLKMLREGGIKTFNSFYRNCYAMLNDIFVNENLKVFCSSDDRGYELVKKTITRQTFEEVRSEMFAKLKADYDSAIQSERNYKTRRELRYWQKFTQEHMNSREVDDWYSIGDKKDYSYNSAVIIPSRVNYIAFYGGTDRKNYQKNVNIGALRIAAYLLENKYLLHELRELGGAYDATAVLFDSGHLLMTSSRDPHLKKTMDVMLSAADFLKKIKIREEELEEIKDKLVNEITDQKQNSPWDDQYEIRCIEIIKRPKNWDKLILGQIMTCDVSDIRAAAAVVKEMIENGYFCVFGNEEDIRKNEELFGDISSPED